MGWTSEFHFPAGAVIKFFFLFANESTALGTTQHPIQWVREAITPEVKRPRREAGYSPVAVKNAWSYNSTAAVRLHDMVLKYRISLHDVVLT
jgi:hypothetical protein